jgi:hypothetical protein
MTGDWRKLYNEKFYNFYPSHIIKVIKSRRIIGTGHITSM